MGIFDMGEGDSGFSSGMSEIRGSNLAAEQQQENQKRRYQSAQAREQAQIQHAQDIAKKTKRIRQIKRLRYIRYIGCCSCSTLLWVLLIAACFAVIIYAIGNFNELVNIARSEFHWYDSAINGVSNFMCWITSGC
jgi:hypothetical protein